MKQEMKGKDSILEISTNGEHLITTDISTRNDTESYPTLGGLPTEYSMAERMAQSQRNLGNGVNST